MKAEDLIVGGAVVYWQLSGDTSFKVLDEELSAIGYRGIVSESRSFGSALQGAIGDCSKDPPKGFKNICRKNQDGDILSILETVGKTNEYRVLFGAKYDKANDCLTFFGDEQPDYETQSKIFQCMKDRLDCVSVQQGTRYVEMLIEKYMNGTQLQKPGIVWLPSSSLPLWDQIRQAFVKASSSGSKFFSIETVITENTVAAIVDALRKEIETECAEIRQGLGRDDITHRGIESLRNRARVAKEKIASYEAITKTSLDELSAAVTDVTTCFVQASLASAASEQN